MPEPNRDTLEETRKDPSHAKGAVSSDRPEQADNTASLNEQIDHRDQRPIKKGQDTDFPEPGSNPEYSMQKEDSQKDQNAEPKQDSKLHPSNDPDGNAGAELNDQDPGETQKRNQNDKKNDDLAA
jgi:hypothetical protein